MLLNVIWISAETLLVRTLQNILEIEQDSVFQLFLPGVLFNDGTRRSVDGGNKFGYRSGNISRVVVKFDLRWMSLQESPKGHHTTHRSTGDNGDLYLEDNYSSREYRRQWDHVIRRTQHTADVNVNRVDCSEVEDDVGPRGRPLQAFGLRFDR